MKGGIAMRSHAAQVIHSSIMERIVNGETEFTIDTRDLDEFTITDLVYSLAKSPNHRINFNGYIMHLYVTPVLLTNPT